MSWIQGKWLREDFIELNLEYGYQFTNDDFCNISLGEKKCSEALDLISVYEEISDDRYLLVTTNNTETVEFEFVKVSTTRIKLRKLLEETDIFLSLN